MGSLYHIRIYSDETLQSHRQNTRNTTLFIAPLADVMHCQVLGGQRGGTGGGTGSYIVQGGYGLALAGGAGVPGGGRTHQHGAAYMAAARGRLLLLLLTACTRSNSWMPATDSDGCAL